MQSGGAFGRKESKEDKIEGVWKEEKEWKERGEKKK